MIKVLYLLLLAAVMSGCASLGGVPDGALAPDPVVLSADYDILDLRIEVFRPFTDEATIGSVSESEASDHPLTVNIGNGLAIDANGVLFLRVDELLGLDRYEDFTVRTTHGRRRTIRRTGEDVRIGTWTWNPFLWRTSIEYENETARVNRSIGHFYVGPTEDGFAWAPRDLEQAEVMVRPYEENSFQVGNTVVTYNPDTSQITFSDARGAVSGLLTRERTIIDRIEFEDNQITVYSNSGPLGAMGLSRRAARIYITENGYEIFGENRMSITLADNEVTIVSGWLPGWLGGRERFRLQ